jgi:hypothetical protein
MIKKLFYVKLLTASVLFANSPVTPESVLPNNVDSAIATNPFNGKQAVVRKGTIGTTIINVARLNQLLDKEKLSAEEVEEFQAICAIERNLINSLDVLGMFDIFSPAEWLNSDQMPGRIYVAMLYLEAYPEKITSEMEKQLEHIATTAQSSLVKQLAAQL